MRGRWRVRFFRRRGKIVRAYKRHRESPPRTKAEIDTATEQLQKLQDRIAKAFTGIEVDNFEPDNEHSASPEDLREAFEMLQISIEARLQELKRQGSFAPTPPAGPFALWPDTVEHYAADAGDEIIDRETLIEDGPVAAAALAEGLDALFRRLGPPPDELFADYTTPVTAGGGGVRA